MKIILSTRNPSKAEQIKMIFYGLPVSILTLSETDIEGEAIENSSTLKDNALKKAKYAHDFAPSGCWAMADDTGLFINALNGEPGVRSARWSGENATTNEITQYCLARLKGIDDRSAFFKTVVALVAPDGQTCFFDGEVNGILLDHPRTSPQPKMPYSPLFVPVGSHKVWAEMTVEEENSISHRGKAFRKARNFLEKKLVK